MRNFNRLLLPLLIFVGVFLFFQKKKNITGNSKQEKVLDVVSMSSVKNLDPTLVEDLYCGQEVSKVYEGLFEYDYFKRPYEIVPKLAVSMPSVSDDHLVYTFTIKQGVNFHDNKCFPNGKGRELVAQDFVYAIKRVADPKVRSPRYALIGDKIKGLEEWHTKYIGAEKVNYDEEIEGIKSLDKYTLQIKLSKPFPQLLHNLTMAYCFVMPREAVEYYGKEFINNPVGTGPFVTETYNPQFNKIVYLKNKNYREDYFPSNLPETYKTYSGKKLPIVDKVVTHIITEEQTQLLNFKKGKIDLMELKANMTKEYIKDDGSVIDELKNKGVAYSSSHQLTIAGFMFNADYDLLKNKKLRQAISLGFDDKKYIDLFLDNTAVVSQSLLPPQAFGYRADYVNEYKQYDLEKAKKLLAEAGYPGGKGLPEITLDVTSDVVFKHKGEFFKNCMEKLGINIKVVPNTWPELLQKVEKKSTMIFTLGWSADYFDSEGFLQILYGPYKDAGSNFCNYDNPEYNKMYERAVLEEVDDKKREEMYFQMNKMIGEEVPMIFLPTTSHKDIYHGWISNFIWSDFNYNAPKYIDVNMSKKKAYL
jgi:oligopeptide transport system substrate-binding protein